MTAHIRSNGTEETGVVIGVLGETFVRVYREQFGAVAVGTTNNDIRFTCRCRSPKGGMTMFSTTAHRGAGRPRAQHGWDRAGKADALAPVFQQAGVTDFRVAGLYLKRTHPDSPAEILATLREVSGTAFVANGRTLTCQYDGAAADALIASLNTTNLSTTSLERRIISRCQADGKLGAGTVSGTPQVP
jgi:hypothetical protein